jgi:hypothetical protein
MNLLQIKTYSIIPKWLISYLELLYVLIWETNGYLDSKKILIKIFFCVNYQWEKYLLYFMIYLKTEQKIVNE